MSSSEIAFLALGLVLGGALGAGFLATVRPRRPSRRDVRITITPNSITARRAVTLSDATPARDRPSPPGSPGEAAVSDRPTGAPSLGADDRAGPDVSASSLRTLVSIGPARVSDAPVAGPAGNGHHPSGPGESGPGTSGGRGHATEAVALMRSTVALAVAERPVAVAERPVAVAVATQAPATRTVLAPTVVLDIGLPVAERLVRPRRPVLDPRPMLASTAIGIPVARAGETSDGPRGGSGAGSAGPGSEATTHDPCAPARTEAEQRCAAADAARERSRTAADAMRESQRAFDTLQEQLDRAREASDPRAIAAAKGQLHAGFREANAKAGTPDEAEAAARRWLNGIDRVNTEARAALRLVEAGTAELRERLPRLERLVADADAARITAESADQACRAAREELARCDELAAASAPPPVAEEPQPYASAWPTEHDLSPNASAGSPAEILAGQPAIIRILRGDRAARDRVVAGLAGTDPASTAAWQLRISALVDAIAARAIEAGYLDLPDDDPFWSLFHATERREIVEALASLGFRYDGLGGFADGRVPAARDLSLAVGYAGLDPMRIRVWPRDPAISVLYAGATVAADEWLITEADDLGLGTVADALGHRAADLGELWNAWGRIRPLLLASD